MNKFTHVEKMSGTSIALGHFDGLHIGHKRVIYGALEVGDAQSVVLSIGKATQSIIDPCERDRLLTQWGVDTLCLAPFDELRELSGEEFVSDILKKRLGAVSISCGFNYHFGKGASCGIDELRRLCANYDIRCNVIGEVSLNGQPVSSTAIRGALQRGEISSVNEMLGRRYGYSFRVIHGNRIGSALGTPTINQVFPAGMLIPRYGVYASRCFVDGTEHKSVTNIGVKPTIGSFDPCSETWILNFSGDLYAESVRVELLDFLRPEQKFSDLDELHAQILTDAARAAEY